MQSTASAQTAKTAVWVDRLGASASLLCAVHCALVPIVLAAIPSVGAGFLSSELYENIFAVFASALAASSVGLSYYRHKRYFAWWFLVPGMIALWFERLFDAIHHDVVMHAIVMTLAGTLVGLSHLINLKLSHGHVHDSSCKH